MTNLDPINVENIYLDCLFKEGEPMINLKDVEGVRSKTRFNLDKVKKNEPKIIDLLDQLPVTFREKEGGGWSFLNACEDINGRLWTGMHPIVDLLVQLGIAIGRVEFCLPKEFWDVMPGGVPYFVYKEKPAES